MVVKAYDPRRAKWSVNGESVPVISESDLLSHKRPRRDHVRFPEKPECVSAAPLADGVTPQQPRWAKRLGMWVLIGVAVGWAAAKMAWEGVRK